jgi:hypothetical protein
MGAPATMPWAADRKLLRRTPRSSAANGTRDRTLSEAPRQTAKAPPTIAALHTEPSSKTKRAGVTMLASESERRAARCAGQDLDGGSGGSDPLPGKINEFRIAESLRAALPPELPWPV